jgi:hypothetical protein
MPQAPVNNGSNPTVSSDAQGLNIPSLNRWRRIDTGTLAAYRQAYDMPSLEPVAAETNTGRNWHQHIRTDMREAAIRENNPLREYTLPDISQGNHAQFYDYRNTDPYRPFPEEERDDSGNSIPSTPSPSPRSAPEITLTISLAVYDFIVEVKDTVVEQTRKELLLQYKKTIDLIENIDYAGYMEYYNAGECTIGLLTDTLQKVLASFNMMRQGNMYRWRNDRLLALVERTARERYDINQSKYRYYPRLKSKVKYGNPELLNSILAVTQLDKGKIICPAIL